MIQGEMSSAWIEASDFGRELADLIKQLYPICRSITGDGIRETLKILQTRIPLTVHAVPSGTEVFDWIVPKEWNIKGAYIKDPNGKRIVDFANSNLHVVGYSIPFQGKLPLKELKAHLFTVPDHIDWVPYRTSYYRESWGFCLAQRQLNEMADGEYEVYIDSSLRDGHLTYGEYYMPGRISDEVLFSCHICHPSLCNDNLSGVALMVGLLNHLRKKQRKFSYRFLFIPGTIGSITWLALNEARVPSIKHGFVVTGVGDKGNFTYKRSRRGNAEIDRVFGYIIKNSGDDSRIVDFHPYGYDERQFCSPGFNMPVGCVMRTPFGEYPEYHTSADNLEFISLESLSDSTNKCITALEILESNETYMNQNPKCEPQLGRRGVYQTVGGQTETKSKEMAMLWVLNLSDGSNSLLDISERSGYPFHLIKNAADTLAECRLVKKMTGDE
jgi:aminopeptidase-like protein